MNDFYTITTNVIDGQRNMYVQRFLMGGGKTPRFIKTLKQTPYIDDAAIECRKFANENGAPAWRYFTDEEYATIQASLFTGLELLAVLYEVKNGRLQERGISIVRSRRQDVEQNSQTPAQTKTGGRSARRRLARK